MLPSSRCSLIDGNHAQNSIGYCSMAMLDAELTGVSASVGKGMLLGVIKLSVVGGVGEVDEAGNTLIPVGTD